MALRDNGRRRLVGAVAGLLALGIAPMVAMAAVPQPSAKTVTVPLTQASWFWREQVGVIGTTGVAPPQSAPDPTVPAGDLAVAGPEGPIGTSTTDGPLDETYLGFDVSAIPVGSAISSFKIALPVDGGSQAVNVGGSGAPIIACAPKSFWSGGQSAAPFQGKPNDTCDTTSPKVTASSDGKSFTVDIAAIAQQWVRPGALNLGVAITDNPANSATIYQVVFGPATALAKLTATVTYNPPVGSDVVPPPVTTTAAGGAAPPPVSVAPRPLPSVSVPVVPTPQVSTAPTVAAPAPEIAPLRLAASSSAPPAEFWVGLALILLLLAASAWVLADPDVPLGQIADRGVSRALRARRAPSNRLQERT